MLTEQARWNRMWGRTPELVKILDQKQLSIEWTGSTSVSDNIFDSTLRMLRLYALVRDNEDEIKRVVLVATGGAIHRELEGLRAELKAFFQEFGARSKGNPTTC